MLVVEANYDWRYGLESRVVKVTAHLRAPSRGSDNEVHQLRGSKPRTGMSCRADFSASIAIRVRRIERVIPKVSNTTDP